MLKSLMEVQSEREEREYMDNYPAGVSSNDPYFDMPSVGDGEETEEDDRSSIPCAFCGRPTTWDPTYQNLCGRCCRASNE